MSGKDIRVHSVAKIFAALDEADVKYPSWLPDSIVSSVVGGSYMYGTSNQVSDIDYFLFSVSPLEEMFPHLKGGIPGFGQRNDEFTVLSLTKIPFEGREMDCTIFGLPNFVNLISQGAINAPELLFAEEDCVSHTSPSWEILRANRETFLTKSYLHKMISRGSAQIEKTGSKQKPHSKTRGELFDKHGFDTKWAMHSVRLLLQVSDILQSGRLDLRKNVDTLLEVRNGGWTLPRIEEWISAQKVLLKEQVNMSSLPEEADMGQVKDLLVRAVEMVHGDLNHALVEAQAKVCWSARGSTAEVLQPRAAGPCP